MPTPETKGARLIPWVKERTPITFPDVNLYRHAEGVLRAWYVMQGQKRHVIDFDLSGETPELGVLAVAYRNNPTKQQQTLIIDQLSALSSNAGLLLNESRSHSVVLSDQGEHALEFTSAQLNASLWYARKLRGDAMSTLDYIENTQDYPQSEASKEILDVHKKIIDQLFEAAGITDSSEKGFLKWREEHSLSEEEAISMLEEESTESIRQKNKFLGRKIEPSFAIIPVHLNEYFWVWIDTDKKTGEFVMQQNFGTESRPKPWTRGKVEELAKHEGGQHASRMAMRRHMINDRRAMSPFFGLTTVHGPEQIVEEGSAQALALLLPGAFEKLSPEGRLQVYLSLYKQMVYGNAHLRINAEEPISKDQFINYVKSHMPWEPVAEIEEQIKERTENPLKQTYLRAYAEGAKIFLVVSDMLSDAGKKTLLGTLDLKPYTAKQLLKLVNKIMQNRRNTRMHMSKWATEEYQLMIMGLEENALHNI